MLEFEGVYEDLVLVNPLAVAAITEAFHYVVLDTQQTYLEIRLIGGGAVAIAPTERNQAQIQALRTILRENRQD